VTDHRAALLGGTADTANVLIINTPTCTSGTVRGILDVPARAGRARPQRHPRRRLRLHHPPCRRVPTT